MIFLNILLVLWCFTGTLAGPIRAGFAINETYDDAEYWQQLLEKPSNNEEDWSWIKTMTMTTTKSPFANFHFNFSDFKVRDYQNPIVWPKQNNDGSTYGSSYTTYSSRRTDYSGAIVIVLIVKFVLIFSCYACRHRKQTPQPRVIRIPNNAQPSSLTVVRRHIFLVVPRNGNQNSPSSEGDDSHDPASHLEQKTLVDEDLPPSYEEVALSNDSNSSPPPQPPSADNNASSIPAPQ